MVDYIIRMVEELTDGNRDTRNSLRQPLADELDKLDPRDFLATARFEFVCLRAQIGQRVRAGQTLEDLTPPLVQVLNKYGGDGSRAETRRFGFIINAQLRQIIERDYKELSLNLLRDRAWKSTVVMAGSILEAILFDVLTADPATLTKAEVSPRAPKEKGKVKVKDIQSGEWKLHNLIEVATDIGVIPSERAETFDRVLRDYRNFVHPKVEIRAAHPCTEAEALMAKGALDAVSNFLESRGGKTP